MQPAYASLGPHAVDLMAKLVFHTLKASHSRAVENPENSSTSRICARTVPVTHILNRPHKLGAAAKAPMRAPAPSSAPHCCAPPPTPRSRLGVVGPAVLTVALLACCCLWCCH